MEKERREHDLKIVSEMFDAVLNQDKKAEFRKDDRGFAVGDVLLLREIDEDGEYTGNFLRRRITHILRAPWSGFPEGYAMLSIDRIS